MDDEVCIQEKISFRAKQKIYEQTKSLSLFRLRAEL